MNSRVHFLALALWCLLLAAGRAATLTFASSAPAPAAAAISSFAGAAFDADNVGGSGANANGGANNGLANDGTTYVAADRPAQGQTFTTGANVDGYTLTSITVRMQGYTNNTASGGNIGGYDLNDTGASFRVRVGRISGTTFIPLSVETAASGGTGNPGQGGTANGPGTYLTFTLANPVMLAPNTVYAADIGIDAGGEYFETLGIRYAAAGGNPYAGGSAYVSGANGGGNNTVTLLAGERVFQVNLAAYTAPAPGVFVHPGLLHTAADFERMRTKVALGAQPWTMGFNALTSNGYSQLGTAPRPLATVIRGGAGQNFNQMVIDIQRAYQMAIRWKVTGDTRYADQTVVFLNAWSSTMTVLTGNADRFLAAGIYGYQWANVAEIMQTYPGWAAADVAQFKNWLLTIYYPMSHDFLVNHNGAAITNYWANWDLCNMADIEAIGVLCDRQDLYNEALNYFYYGGGNGAIDKAVYFIHPGNLGQWQESGRDQGHCTLGPSLMGPICQTAWNQGLDLFSYGNNRFLAGAEYVAKYNLFYDVPYEPYEWGNGQSGAWSQQPVVSNASRGNGRGAWELIYNHYVNRAGFAAKYSLQRVLALQPEGGSGNGDELGFGTLTYSLDPIASGTNPQLTAYEREGAVFLNWWGSAYATGYNVYRSSTLNGTYTKIASNITDLLTYTDYSPAPGANYYKVTGTLTSSETGFSNIVRVAAGELHTQLLFNEGSGTTAADASGNAHTGTLINGAAWTSGNSGNAVSLSGDDDFVALPAGLMTDLGDFTISTWVYLNSLSNWMRIFDFGDSNGRYMYLTPRSNSGVVRYSIGTNYGYNEQPITGTAALPTGQWVHVAVTMANRVGRLYVNGVIVGASWVDFPPFQLDSTSRNWIGRSQYPDPYLNGKVDDFRIYRGALGAGTIYTLATGTSAPAPPAAPAGSSAAAVAGNQINLSWTASSGTTSYNVKRAITSGGPYTTIGFWVKTTTFSDYGLTAGTTYYYVTTAANNGGDGANSPQASATALPPMPSVPAGLTAIPVSSSAIALDWSGAANAASYNVKRSLTSGGTYTTIASGVAASAFTDTGLSVGTTYYYVVSAVNASGESANSNEDAAAPSEVLVHLRFDETSGTTAADSSGNGWNATLLNAPAWTTGRLGGAINFAAASSQSATLPAGVVSSLNDFTITAWVNPATFGTWARVFDFGTGTDNYMFLSIQYTGTAPDAAKPRFAIRTPSVGEQGLNSSIALTPGTWNHLAVTLSGNTNTATLYVNGAVAATNTGVTLRPSTLGTTTQNYLADSQWSADPYLDGKLDEFLIFNRALTAAEVAAFAPPPVAPAGLNATAGNAQCALAWTAVSGATAYRIQRATVSGGPYATVGTSATASFTNTGLSNGTPYYYLVATLKGVAESTASAEVSATPQTPFVQWQQAWFTPAQLADPFTSGADADANGDGMMNLLAYAFNASPWTNLTPSLPTAQVTGGYLTITYIRRKAPTDISYTVEVAGTPGSWNSGAAFTTETGVTSIDATTERVIVRDNTLATGTARRFIRVKVSY